MTVLNKSRREKKKEDKLRKIEDAARALFRDRGYEATTTREIAERADIGTGTLFVYFKEKRELLAHLFCTDIAARVEEARRTVREDDDLLDQVMHFFLAIYRYYEEDPRLGRVIVKELLYISPDFGANVYNYTLEFFGDLAVLVERAKARGEIGEHVLPLQAAWHFFSFYYFALVSWLGGLMPLTETRDAQLRSALECLIRGMRASTETEREGSS